MNQNIKTKVSFINIIRLSYLNREEFSQKFERVLRRNRGYNKIVDINNVLNDSTPHFPI